MSSDVKDRTSPPQAATSPHPRIRARRVAVARDVGRVRRRRLNAFLGVVCVVVWTLVVLRSSLVDVDRVQVAGAEHTSATTIRAAAGIDPGESMTSVDRGAVIDAVAELPWIDDVRVERMWPGTIRIVVTEREPVVVVETPDGAAVADGDGRVLAEVGSAPGLVALLGRRDVTPGETLPPADRTVLAVAAQLPPALAEEVEAAAVGDPGVVLDLDGGWSVVVGDEADLMAKSGAALAVRHAADPADGCVIDVRVPSAPVVTRASPSTDDSPLTDGGTCA